MLQSFRSVAARSGTAREPLACDSRARGQITRPVLGRPLPSFDQPRPTSEHVGTLGKLSGNDFGGQHRTKLGREWSASGRIWPDLANIGQTGPNLQQTLAQVDRTKSSFAKLRAQPAGVVKGAVKRGVVKRGLLATSLDGSSVAVSHTHTRPRTPTGARSSPRFLPATPCR